ncbi:MAG: MerR family transcriptional regulator [Chitinivibrionales bacterium]|nr:MerR family transcriptional regulator [Chitinivibrionales bacterium]MBD3356528.1 MerR family transcriptional regulator [Chitinivibrionales bacterium]
MREFRNALGKNTRTNPALHRLSRMPRQIDPNKPLFTIAAVGEILGIKPRMLRAYEERGLITPSRSDGNHRLYSLNDIDVLAYIHYLTYVKKVNTAGVHEIQRIVGKLDEETYTRFMEEVEREIESLPQDKKRAFLGEGDELEDEVLKGIEIYGKRRKKRNPERS